MEFVIKITKLCNLRCDYCYEYAHLGDKRRMSLDEIKIIFEKTAILVQYRNSGSAKFIWHGGEPLIIEPAYYEAIWEIQDEIFYPLGIEVINSIQTNLTLLTDTYLGKIKKGIFDSIGVSYDLVGSHRVNIAGKPMQKKTRENMQKLMDNDIPFGVITVLTSEAAQQVEEIYSFFDTREISISFLPLFQSQSGMQPLKESICEEEIVNAYKKLFDCWLASPTATRILPLDYHMDDLISEIAATKNEKEIYNRDTDEWVWVINTDGNVYPYDDEYKPEIAYGNIFNDPIDTILSSPNRKRMVETSKQRIAEVCTSCSHFGYCSGYYIGDSIYPFYDKSGKLACGIVKPTLDYIHQRLIEEDLIKELI